MAKKPGPKADPRREDRPQDANEALLDATLRHQIALRRYTTGEVRRIQLLLERSDTDLIRRIRRRLEGMTEGSRDDFSTRRLQELMKEIAAARTGSINALRDQLRGDMIELSRAEAEAEQRILLAAIPVEISMVAVASERLRALVTQQPFAGLTLSKWFDSLTRSDMRRLFAALQTGLVEGETIDQLVRRVGGTKALGYSDGVLAQTRRETEAIVRTSVTHVSNAAREELWKGNEDIIQGLRWTSTLDGRTSAVCRARDGEVFPLGQGPRPPAHPNCRSVMVAVIDGLGVVGTRPSVTDTRTRREREIDFRAEARKTGVPIKDVRRAWANDNIGPVPGATTYQQWLTRQPAAFQDDVLGVSKGQLFRRGGLRLDQFIDTRGHELTLDELRVRWPEQWRKAGLAA